ncbi:MULTISPECIES: hypothetical protein [Sorangium]|uniref:hypothetical protein n=1 Tax=Sorangium TaxID=39643 RepID=UPI001019FC3F|nr:MULTISPECIES: hypothetical protein [Sorangium]
MGTGTDRRLQSSEINLVDLGGSGSKHPRNIGVAGFDDADIPPHQRKRREDQREEQRDPREE